MLIRIADMSMAIGEMAIIIMAIKFAGTMVRAIIIVTAIAAGETASGFAGTTNK